MVSSETANFLVRATMGALLISGHARICEISVLSTRDRPPAGSAREKLGRVSAYSWTASMTFLPLGYAIAGWVGAGIGNSTYLLVGAIWVVVTTAIAVSVRDVRDFRLRPSLQEPDLAASVPAS